jgi:hypothetical protein
MMTKSPVTSARQIYFVERRRGIDRRKTRLGGILPPFFSGRRRHLRRVDDRRKFTLLDHYSPKIFAIIVVILLLSLVDAVMTLVLISHGAVELNPVMAYLLSKGDTTFLVVKYLLTAVSVTIVALINYVFIRIFNTHVRNLLLFFAGCFALVVAWELFLMVRHGLY